MLVVFLFSKIKNQKKAFNLIIKNKIQIQIQIQNTDSKNKVNNIMKKQKTSTENNKKQTYIINYKLLMMIVDINITPTRNFEI